MPNRGYYITKLPKGFDIYEYYNRNGWRVKATASHIAHCPYGGQKGLKWCRGKILSLLRKKS